MSPRCVENGRPERRPFVKQGVAKRVHIHTPLNHGQVVRLFLIVGDCRIQVPTILARIVITEERFERAQRWWSFVRVGANANSRDSKQRRYQLGQLYERSSYRC